jgi:hypothetical protein
MDIVFRELKQIVIAPNAGQREAPSQVPKSFPSNARPPLQCTRKAK